MSQFLSLFGWAFLPSLVTSWLMTIWYGVTIRAGEPKPTPGSPTHEKHRRRIQCAVISAYLLYTIFEADYDIRRAGSFYSALGVAPDSPERDIKTRFRRLAALHHPDKVGAGADAAAGHSSALFFMHLKTASETLQDAAKRFAYDRFGPGVVDWTKCVTVRDYVKRGVMRDIVPHYVVAAASIMALSLLKYIDFARYYRWLILVTLFVFEVTLATRPTFPPFLNAVNAVLTRVSSHPPYLPYQVMALCRKITLTVYIAFAQLGPLLRPAGGPGAAGGETDDQALQQGLDRLEALVKQTDMDASRMVDMELAPFKADAGAAANLQGKMKEWLVQNTVRADPMVRDAVGTSLRRRRTDAPAGARGTK